MRKLLLIGGFTLFCIGILSAKNYYVDAVNGSDANPGTSLKQPWKTVNKVNSPSV